MQSKPSCWGITAHAIKVGLPVNQDIYSSETVFVLVNATDGKNFIYHLHMYQGKNANHMVEEAWLLPTTQKAAMNAVVQSGRSKDPFGKSELYMDKCYSTSELCVLLREEYQILCCGTICNTKKGWDMMVTNLLKKSSRGSSLVKCDLVNRILFGQ
jgi:hypothetical protein